MGHPICLFGEDAGARRERLKITVQEYFIQNGEVPTFAQRPNDQEES
jgi:hypothetical protein